MKMINDVLVSRIVSLFAATGLVQLLYNILIIEIIFLFIWNHILVYVIMYYHPLLMFFSLQFFNCLRPVYVIETKCLSDFLFGALRIGISRVLMVLCQGIILTNKERLDLDRGPAALDGALPVAWLDATRNSADKFLFSLIKYFDIVNMLIDNSRLFFLIHWVKWGAVCSFKLLFFHNK